MWQGCVNRHRPAGSVLRVVAWGQGYCHLTFDILPTKGKTELFSDVRYMADDCRCVSFFSDGYDSVTAAKLRNGFDICKLFEPRRAILRYEAVFDSLYPDYFSSFLSFSPLSRTLI